MKKIITTGILTLATAFGFAQEIHFEQKLPDLAETIIPTASFSYLKMGVSDLSLDRGSPGVGVGYRLNAGRTAIDISAAFNYLTGPHNGGKRIFHWTLPRVNYLVFLDGIKLTNFYAGAGLGWGGVKVRKVSWDDNWHKKSETNFIGLIPNATLGYEFNRSGRLRSFVQLDVSKATIAAYRKGALPKAFAELSVGTGF